MEAQKERDAFSARLKEALAHQGCPKTGPADVVREFNRRFPGTPVTAHAVRKWLMAESIPAQAKLKTLAEWLGVSPEWLRFGAGEISRLQASEAAPEMDFQLMREIAALSTRDQDVVRTLVKALRRAE